MSAVARAVVFACFAILLLSCDTGPARSPASYPPRRISLDVELPVWAVDGQFGLTSFTATLRDELASYNVHVDDKRTPGEDLVLVNLTPWENRHAIDVILDRAGQKTSLGRVLVPDRTMTTLDVAAGLVGSIIARGLAPAVDPAPPPPT
jgi:hypothetical protein